MYSGWDTYVAQVAEVAVSDAGEVRVKRVVCAVDCGTVVNPDSVKAQIEGGAIFGISGALYGGVTPKNGRAGQSHFHDARVLRRNETPPTERHTAGRGERPRATRAPRRWGLDPAMPDVPSGDEHGRRCRARSDGRGARASVDAVGRQDQGTDLRADEGPQPERRPSHRGGSHRAHEVRSARALGLESGGRARRSAPDECGADGGAGRVDQGRHAVPARLIPVFRSHRGQRGTTS